MELVGDGRRDGCGIIGWVHPVVAGERIAELLELPDGCMRCLSMLLTVRLPDFWSRHRGYAAKLVTAAI